MQVLRPWQLCSVKMPVPSSKEMPPQVFNDGEQRFAVFNAVQQALDAAIDREEY